MSAPAVSPPAEPPSGYGRDLLRRSVLVLMTALLVARPLVLGEDPSLSSTLSDPGSFVLSLLTLCTALGWAAWRFWTKQSTWYGGLVELGLFLIVVGSFVSTAVASNKHAAWLTAWEWLVLLVGFSTLRQLAIGRAEIQGFLSALLATAVALIFFAVYQGAIELPALAQRIKTDTTMLDGYGEMAKQALRERVEDGHVYGTYAHPNSFSGYLVLFLPGLFGVAWLARHVGRPVAQRLFILAFAVIGIGALYLTHSRGAMLGLLVAATLVAAILARRWLAANPAYLLGCIVGLVALGVLGYLLTRAAGKTTETAAVRLEYWSATGRMLRENPLLGVGPGNFGTAYPRYMAANSIEKIKDPHNLFLELWATTGLLGFVGLLVMVGAFLWHQRTLLHRPESLLDDSPSPEPEAAEASVRWEFYVGGALGLLLGFALRAVGLVDREAIYLEGLSACGRTVFWFAAFALFEQVLWPTRFRSLMLTVGILALLANLFVSGGIGFPSVVGLLLAAMALALNSPLPRPVPFMDRFPAVAATLPFPVTFAAILVYCAGVFYPTVGASTMATEALVRGRFYLEDQARMPKDRLLRVPNHLFEGASNPMYGFLRDRVVNPLLEARKLDAWDPNLPCHIAYWYGQLWLLNPADKEIGIKAVQWAKEGQKLDPAGRAGYQTEADLREMFARRLEMRQGPGLLVGNAYALFLKERGPLEGTPGTLRNEIRVEYREAARSLEQFQQAHDPTDAPLSFEIANLYAKADDQANLKRHAERALELDNVARGGLRRLSDPQRTRLQTWLEPPNKS